MEDNPDVMLAAAALFRSTPLRPVLALCCEDAGTTLARHGRRDEAITLLAEAAAIHADIGAFGEAVRVDAALLALGARPKRVRSNRPTFGWESLTPMELSVSELVADGLTNPEIGTRLFVSRRTVETHISHVFRKIGCVSRSQLAAEITRRTETSRMTTRSSTGCARCAAVCFRLLRGACPPTSSKARSLSARTARFSRSQQR